MRVVIGKYKNWVGPYQIADILKYIGVSEERRFAIGDKLSNTFVSDLCEWIHKKQKRKIEIRIDRWDTWSMDHTLSLIILPMLKQLKEKKHGSPYVDDEDVPKKLRLGRKWKKIFDESYKPEYTDAQKEEADDRFHARWMWILDEMIWTFEQISNSENEYAFFNSDGKILDKNAYSAYQERIANGTRLFGKYYCNLWD
jgi:hypothetical protein